MPAAPFRPRDYATEGPPTLAEMVGAVAAIQATYRHDGYVPSRRLLVALRLFDDRGREVSPWWGRWTSMSIDHGLRTLVAAGALRRASLGGHRVGYRVPAPSRLAPAELEARVTAMDDRRRRSSPMPRAWGDPAR